MGQLRRLFSEGVIARLLNEEDDSMAHESGASGDSLDAQIDRYFGEYEGAAKEITPTEEPSVDQMESLDWRDLVKGRVILGEAGEGDKDEEGAEDAAPGADAMTGGEDEKPGLDALNIEMFANDVARLIENYDSLLEVRSTIVRRAQKFIEKNYGDDVVKAFENTLRDDHGLEAGSSSADIARSKFTAPAADRANGSAEPGTGGGGAV